MVILTEEGASSSSSSSSSSSTHRWKYDVFLSFRGEDTRNNFTSHLYKALCNQGFDTFIDDDLPRGEEISMKLVEAIESSMILIVIFSKNFASSTWCLNELVKIFECKSNGQLIFPIFYKVSPSEIRKQDGEFGIALAEHEEKCKDDIEKVQRWRTTLTEAANLSGFPYNDSCVESEAELIERVIKEISSTKLNLVPLFVAKHPVGIDIRAEAIELLLDMESNDVCMVGIWGLGGIDDGIGRLIDKCLVTLEHGYLLSMHDLLQRMGREIVRQESEEIERRSRIWRYKDAHKLLTRNMGSKRIRGIMLCSPKPIEVALNANVFKRMKNLKFLIGNVHIVEDLEYLPDELRFLEWRKFPLSLSSKCCAPEELVAINLSKSNIILEKAFKQGFQYENLKMISLVSCEFITNLPDLCCPNLEILEIKYCKNLIEVDKSIGFHEKLKEWNLYGCPQLQILPSTLMLKSLESFELCRCRRLEKFPDIHPEMNCLKYLDLFGCGFRELPSSLLYLTGLNPLGLGVSKLTNFLVGANNFNNFSGPTGFLCLTTLNLRGSPRIGVELDSWLQPDYFPVLERLDLSSTGIVTIPASIFMFTTLEYLDIQDCKKLREIPILPQSMRQVCATNCDRLDARSSFFLLIHFRLVLQFLAKAATCFGSERPQIGTLHHLELPITEIPEWLKFNHHQSVGNSVSFLVGPKFSNLFVCIAIPSKDLDNDIVSMCEVDFFINGIRQFQVWNWWAKGNYDHVWLTYGKVNISNTSEENRIVVEFKGQNIPLHRMRIYAACICCPQKPIFLVFNNGEEDPGWLFSRPGEPGDDDSAGQSGTNDPYCGELEDDDVVEKGGNDSPYYGEPGDDGVAEYGGSHGTSRQGEYDGPYYGESGDNDAAGQDGTDETFYGEPENDDDAVQGGNDDQYYGELEDDDTNAPDPRFDDSSVRRLKFASIDYRDKDDKGIDQTGDMFLPQRMPRNDQVRYFGEKYACRLFDIEIQGKHTTAR
uniref:TIR domain-containing protein n=1 Tax=Quercus lobata TaxID=97700 RepID=A0A7N2LEV9_QUELO